MNEIIRKASIEDAYGISYVSAYSWTETYTGLVSNEYLSQKINNLSEKAKKTEEFLKTNHNYLVAVVDNQVVGFCNYRKLENDLGKISALYLLKKYQKQGIGKKLFFEGISKLIDLNCNKMIIECMHGNETINFYKHYDGKVIKTIDYYLKNNEKVKVDILEFNNIKNLLNKNNKKSYNEKNISNLSK